MPKQNKNNSPYLNIYDELPLLDSYKIYSLELNKEPLIYQNPLDKHPIIKDKEIERLSNLIALAKEIALAKAIKVGQEANKKIKDINYNDESIISKDEYFKLLDLAKKGDRAREILIRANLKLVIYYAYKYKNKTNLSLEDLIQEGNLGLMRAVELYNPSMKNRFSTYDFSWINKKMQNYIANEVKDYHFEDIKNDNEDMDIDIVDNDSKSPYEKKIIRETKEEVIKFLEDNFSKNDVYIYISHRGFYGDEPKTFLELEKELNINKNTIRDRYEAIIKKLRESKYIIL